MLGDETRQRKFSMYPDVVYHIFHYPKRAMYGIFTYMYNKNQPIREIR